MLFLVNCFLLAAAMQHTICKRTQHSWMLHIVRLHTLLHVVWSCCAPLHVALAQIVPSHVKRTPIFARVQRKG